MKGEEKIERVTLPKIVVKNSRQKPIFQLTPSPLKRRAGRLKPIHIRPKNSYPNMFQDKEIAKDLTTSCNLFPSNSIDEKDENNKENDGSFDVDHSQVHTVSRKTKIIEEEEEEEDKPIMNTCDICQKTQDSCTKSMICTNCRNHKTSNLFKWIAGIIFFLLLLVIGILIYFLIEKEDLKSGSEVEMEYVLLSDNVENNDLILDLKNSLNRNKMTNVYDNYLLLQLGKERLRIANMEYVLADYENKFQAIVKKSHIHKKYITHCLYQIRILYRKLFLEKENKGLTFKGVVYKNNIWDLENKRSNLEEYKKNERKIKLFDYLKMQENYKAIMRENSKLKNSYKDQQITSKRLNLELRRANWELLHKIIHILRARETRRNYLKLHLQDLSLQESKPSADNRSTVSYKNELIHKNRNMRNIFDEVIKIQTKLYSCENNLQLLKHELNHPNKEIMPFHEPKKFLKNDIKHHCSSLLFQKIKQIPALEIQIHENRRQFSDIKQEFIALKIKYNAQKMQSEENSSLSKKKLLGDEKRNQINRYNLPESINKLKMLMLNEQMLKYATNSNYDALKDIYIILLEDYTKLTTSELSLRASLESLKSNEYFFYYSSAYLQTQMQILSTDLTFNILQSKPLITFCSIFWNEGIFYWYFDEQSKSFKNIQLTEGLSNLEHRGGVISMEGIYIVAGGENMNVKIYNMAIPNQSYPSTQLLKVAEHTDYVNLCFKFDYEEVICIDDSGYAYKYKYKTLAKEIFYSNTEERIISGVRTEDGLVILGGNEGKLIILDAQGNLIKLYEYPSIRKVNQIAEVREGSLLLTADGDFGCYLHDMRDPYFPVSQQIFSGGNWNMAITSLTSNSADFAIGGWRKSSTSKGFVSIYRLSDDNTQADLLRSLDNIEREGCCIYVIKEIKTGILIIGGNYACEEICLWNYANLWTDSDAYCWDDLTDDYISDFIAII